MSEHLPDAAGLFRRHHLEIFRFLRRMTADNALAEDLCQEVFVRVARGLRGYAEQGLERSWLYRISRNVLANHRRGEQRRPRPDGLDELWQEPAKSADADLRLGLDEALATLSPSDREVFLLREVGGLSYEEIAHSCELSEGAVRSRLHRARRDLRSHLTPSAGLQPVKESRS